MAQRSAFLSGARKLIGSPGALAVCESGAAILEFALVLPIVLILLGGAFEIGRALLIREAMIGAVRSGASHLARVPDPSCDGPCAPGAARAAALALDQIVENSGLARTAITVSPRWDRDARTVTVRADLKLDIDILRLAGVSPFMTLEVSQTERCLAD